MTSATTPSLLILGLGNVLCSDDGLGVEVVHRLHARFEIPDGVQILDGGTLGMELLHHLAAADDVILVDAVRDDLEAGSLVRITGNDVAPAVRDRLSVHQVGVADLLDGLAFLDAVPAQLSILGLVPADLGLGVGLSPPVAAGLDALVAAVVDECTQRGVPLRDRRAHHAANLAANLEDATDPSSDPSIPPVPCWLRGTNPETAHPEGEDRAVV